MNAAMLARLLIVVPVALPVAAKDVTTQTDVMVATDIDLQRGLSAKVPVLPKSANPSRG